MALWGPLSVFSTSKSGQKGSVGDGSTWHEKLGSVQVLSDDPHENTETPPIRTGLRSAAGPVTLCVSLGPGWPEPEPRGVTS